MREPVTIGDQTFIFDESSGWIDKKTQKPAAAQLKPILDLASAKAEDEKPTEPEELEQTTTANEQPVPEKKKRRRRSKIDTSVEPVTIYGQKFVFDVNIGWIDAKTKEKAPENLKNVLSFVSPPKKSPEELAEEELEIKKREDKAIANILGTSPETIRSFGMLGQITGSKEDTVEGQYLERQQRISEKEKEQVSDAKKVKGDETVVTVKKSLVKIIKILASIDKTIKSKIKNKRLAASTLAAQQRELNIENIADDRVQKISEDAEKDLKKQAGDTEEDASPIGKLALAGAAITAIALLYDPIANMISKFANAIKSVASTVTTVVSKVNEVFEFLLNPLGGGYEDTQSQVANQTRSSGVGSSEDSPAAADTEQETEDGEELTQDQEPVPLRQDEERTVTPDATVSEETRNTDNIPMPPVPASNNRSAAPVQRPPATPPPRQTRSPVASAVTSVATNPIMLSNPITAPIALAAAAGSAIVNWFTGGDETQPAAPAQRSDATAEPPAATQSDATGINPRDVLTFTSQSGSEANFNALAPETKNALLNAAQEYKNDTGRKLTLTSGRRNSDDQVRLWNMSVSQGHPGRIRWPSGRVTDVARPGTSAHESGYAVDIAQGDSPQVQSIMRKHGLIWEGRSDVVHFTLQGHGGRDGGVSGTFGQAVDAVVDTIQEISAPVIQTVMAGLSKFIDTDTEFRNIPTESENDLSKIAAAARETQAIKVESRTAPPPSSPSVTAVVQDKQNANPDPNGTVETIRERDDSVIITQYLYYFNLNPKPATPLP